MLCHLFAISCQDMLKLSPSDYSIKVTLSRLCILVKEDLTSQALVLKEFWMPEP